MVSESSAKRWTRSVKRISSVRLKPNYLVAEFAVISEAISEKNLKCEIETINKQTLVNFRFRQMTDQ